MPHIISYDIMKTLFTSYWHHVMPSVTVTSQLQRLIESVGFDAVLILELGYRVMLGKLLSSWRMIFRRHSDIEGPWHCSDVSYAYVTSCWYHTCDTIKMLWMCNLLLNITKMSLHVASPWCVSSCWWYLDDIMLSSLHILSCWYPAEMLSQWHHRVMWCMSVIEIYC